MRNRPEAHLYRPAALLLRQQEDAQPVNLEGPLDYDFSHTHQEAPRDGDYYVRVKQPDGDMACFGP